MSFRRSNPDRAFRLFTGVFGVIFVLAFCAILTMWGVGAYLAYTCYTSNDPNSMACFMMSDRVEMGVRYR